MFTRDKREFVFLALLVLAFFKTDVAIAAPDDKCRELAKIYSADSKKLGIQELAILRKCISDTMSPPVPPAPVNAPSSAPVNAPSPVPSPPAPASK